MSRVSARSDAKSHSARDHWLAKQVFDWSGLNVAHIRPTYFTSSHSVEDIHSTCYDRNPLSQPGNRAVTELDQPVRVRMRRRPATVRGYGAQSVIEGEVQPVRELSRIFGDGRAGQAAAVGG